MNKKSLGFTLIELLVVVAIISLLSSVVLAAIKDARDKASDNAVRQSIGQFVNALELYRAEYGTYPNQQISTLFNNGKSNLTDNYFPTEISKYIKEFPRATKNVTFIRYIPYNPSIYIWGCFGDTAISPYIILVTTTSKVFNDWPTDKDLKTDKCFSIK